MSCLAVGGREPLPGTLSGERCGDTGGRTSDESTPILVGTKNKKRNSEGEDEVRYTQLGWSRAAEEREKEGTATRAAPKMKV